MKLNSKIKGRGVGTVLLDYITDLRQLKSMTYLLCNEYLLEYYYSFGYKHHEGEMSEFLKKCFLVEGIDPDALQKIKIKLLLLEGNMKLYQVTL